MVAANRLHGGIVDDAYRLTESGREIEFHPPGAEVMRFRGDAAVEHEARIADRHGIEGRLPEALAKLVNHALRSHCGPGGELCDPAMGHDAKLDVRAADVDHENAAGSAVRRCGPFPWHPSIVRCRGHVCKPLR